MPINRNPHDRATRIRVQRQREKISKILKNHEQEIKVKNKITNLGVGYKIQNKKISKDVGILAFVTKRLTDSELHEKKIERLPEKIDGIVTDIVEFPSGIQPTSGISAYTTIKGGMPARHYENPGSGTLGIILKRVKQSANVSGGGIQIPSWIKNNAKWWSEKKISDEQFVQSIQWLIKEEIIKIPATQPSDSMGIKIPDYIKNNAGLWAENKISDAEFVNGIQFLIKQGIMKVPSAQAEELYALTNSHVGAIESVKGASSPAQKNDKWTFPGFLGHKNSPLKGLVAKLEKWNEILLRGPNSFNYYDAALAKISDEWKNYANPYEIVDIGKVKGIEDAEIGDQVMKYGKNSNLTEGIIAGIVPYPQTITINYDGNNCDFTEQLIIVGNPSSTPFSGPGDSGSLVVSKETDLSGAHAAMALLFSGATAANGIYYAFASPIKKIAEDFELDFNS